jgi:hypothetical protein
VLAAGAWLGWFELIASTLSIKSSTRRREKKTGAVVRKKAQLNPFFSHPDYNRRCWNFTSSTAEPQDRISAELLAN